MVNCEKFTEILAAGEDASPREAEEARAHAAVCEECRRVAEAFAAFEGAQAEVPPAPAGFAGRVMARLPLGSLGAERRPLSVPARINLTPAWIFSGVAAAVAAVLSGGAVYWDYTDPEGFAAAANALDTLPAVNVTTFGSIMGAFAAAAVVAGFLAYYYLVPSE
jgi:hypothetical protein